MSDKSTSEKEVNNRFEMLKQRYGDRLNPQELDEVRAEVESLVKAAEALRSVKLDSGDEPLSPFVPYRKEG